MEKSKAIRGGHRSAVTRLIRKTDEKLEIDDVNRQDLQAALQTLERKLIVLQTMDSEILESTVVEDINQEIIDSDEYNLQVEATIIRYKEILEKINTPIATPTVHAVSDFSDSQLPHTSNSVMHDTNQNTNQYPSITHNTHEVRQPTYDSMNFQPQRFHHTLPTLDLPTFSGDILLWQTFWESFESTVHANPALTNVQKFSYLKAQLQSEADRCISGLSLTHANYEQVISLLKDRFGRQNKIIDAHMQKLIDLPNSTMSVNSLRHFYDKIETSIRGLESLGQFQDTYGALLTPIIFRKLPSELRKNLTREHGSYNWDINALRKAIGKELEVQEAGQPSYAGELQPISTASFVVRANQNQLRSNMQNQSKKIAPTCVYCDQHHFSSECTKFKDHESRYAFVKRKQLCFNCLGAHKVSECRSKFKCKKCDKMHHTSLCYIGDRSTVQPTAVHSVNSDDHDTIPTSAFYTSLPPAQDNTEILLKTAVAPVCYENRNAEAYILLDEGSQKSFISEDLAMQLQLKHNGKSTISLSTFGDTSPNIRHVNKATINLGTQNGDYLKMEVLIVPQIAAPLTNTAQVEAAKLPYLKDLKLAHPVTKDQKFEISLLIGADYYWNIVEDKIIRGTGPTAVQSKLGYLLSGPVKTKPNDNLIVMMNVFTSYKFEAQNLERFWNLQPMDKKIVTNIKETKFRTRNRNPYIQDVSDCEQTQIDINSSLESGRYTNSHFRNRHRSEDTMTSLRDDNIIGNRNQHMYSRTDDIVKDRGTISPRIHWKLGLTGNR